MLHMTTLTGLPADTRNHIGKHHWLGLGFGLGLGLGLPNTCVD